MCIDRVLKAAAKYVDLTNLVADSNSLEKIYRGEINNAKKEFAEALNRLIDFRVEAAIDDYERASSTSNIDGSALLNALKSCPPPPESLDEDWLTRYKHWYDNNRSAAISHKK